MQTQTNPAIHPLQLFCDRVITTAIRHLIDRPARSPDALQEEYSTLEQGDPMWPLLYKTNLLPPLQFNRGTDDILNYFYDGLCDWIDQLVERGVLFRHQPLGSPPVWEWTAAMVTPWKRESAESCPLLGQWVRDNIWRQQYIAVLGELSRADKDFVRPQSARYWARLRELAPELFEPPLPAPPSNNNNHTAANLQPPAAAAAAGRDRQRQQRRPSELCFTTGRMRQTGIAGIGAGILPDSLRDLAKRYSGRVVQHKISHRRNQLKVDELADLYAAVSLAEERGALLGQGYDDEDGEDERG